MQGKINEFMFKAAAFMPRKLLVGKAPDNKLAGGGSVEPPQR